VVVITKKYGAISAIDTTVAVMVVVQDDGDCNGSLSTQISFCKFEICTKGRRRRSVLLLEDTQTFDTAEG